jgi:hypothetical protein
MRISYCRVSILVFGLILSTGASARVNQTLCKDVDYSEKFGPVRSQGSAGQCFNFVAADLIGFNQGLGPSQRVSAADVTVNYFTLPPDRLAHARDNASDWENSLWAGKVGMPALQRLRQETSGKSIADRLRIGGDPRLTILAYGEGRGICLESRLPSEGELLKLDARYFLQDELQRMAANEVQPTNSALMPFQKWECPGPRRSLFKPLLNANEQFNEYALRSLGDAIEKKCEPRRPITPMSPRGFRVKRGSTAVTGAAIATFLKSGVPVGVFYDSSYLTDGPAAPASPADHASIVVGTRWNSTLKTCEFKVRNSWGVSCDSYHSAVKKNCEAGNLWVPEDDLYARVENVYIIDPQSQNSSKPQGTRR